MLHIDVGLTLYVTLLAAAVGAVGGSFINCLAIRLARGERISVGRSHCMSCGHTLNALDLIPIFGWLLRRGRCHYCGEKISIRYPAVECLMAVFSVMLLFHLDLTPEYPLCLGFSFILLAMALVDLETMEIPDRFQLAAILWWAVLLPFRREPMAVLVTMGLLGGILIAGALLVLSLILDRVLGQESMGGGDIKLFFITGLYFGFWVNFFHLILSCLVGLAFSLFYKGVGEEDQKKAFPFGPAIALSACITMMIGRQAVDWYLGLY